MIASSTINQRRRNNKLQLETEVLLSQTQSLSVSVDSHSHSHSHSSGINQDTLHPSSVGLPPTSLHNQTCLLAAHVSFDPIVRIIRTPDYDDSSDDDLPALSTRRRSRNILSKGPVRLCTKKFTLPLNISTSSLIGAHHNQSTCSLPPPLPSGAHSARQLFEQTRQEIEEDEQFIPDTPRHLNLTLPLITRQPSRRTIRRQEQRRLERWRELYGGGKPSLKSSRYSHLNHLSADLRKLLSESSLPVQISTNTAINSIHSSISPADVLIEQSKTKPPLKPNLTELQKEAHIDSLPPLASTKPSQPVDSQILDPQHSLSDILVDELSSSQSEKEPAPLQNVHKFSRFGWLNARLKAKQLNKQRGHHGATVPDTTSNPPLLKDSLPPSEGAPLQRMSTPCAPVNETSTAGAPLQRTSTPATGIRKQSTWGAPLQHSTTPGAHLERQQTPGAPLRRFSPSYTSSSTHNSRATSFLRRLIHWPSKPLNANETTPNHDHPSVPMEEPLLNLPRPYVANISQTSLPLDHSHGGLVDKWCNRREVSLRQCCQACLSCAEVGKDPSHEITFSDRARKHYYTKSWFLEDVVKQDGIPAQQVKLISKELGMPYDAWVSQVIES